MGTLKVHATEGFSYGGRRREFWATQKTAPAEWLQEITGPARGESTHGGQAGHDDGGTFRVLGCRGL